MSESVPAKFWERVKAFLAASKTGQIVFHVKDGKILVMDLEETIRL